MTSTTYDLTEYAQMKKWVNWAFCDELRGAIAQIGKHPEALKKAVALVEQMVAANPIHTQWFDLKKRLLGYQRANPADHPLLALGIKVSSDFIPKTHVVSKESWELMMGRGQSSSAAAPARSPFRERLSQRVEAALIRGDVQALYDMIVPYEHDLNVLTLSQPIFDLVHRYQSTNLPLTRFLLRAGADITQSSFVVTDALYENWISAAIGAPLWKPVLRTVLTPRIWSASASHFLTRCVQTPGYADVLFDVGFNPSKASLNNLGKGIATERPPTVAYASTLVFNGVDIRNTRLIAVPRFATVSLIRNAFFAQHNGAMATYCHAAFPKVVATIIVSHALTDVHDVSFEARAQDKNAVTLFRDMRTYCYVMLQAQGFDFLKDWENA